MRILFLSLLFLLGLQTTSWAQTGNLQGKVYNQHTVALRGATVALEPDKHWTTTDKDGNFSIPNLYPGTYSIRISHIDYPDFVDTVLIEVGKDAVKWIQVVSQGKSIEEVLVKQKMNEQESPDQLLKLSRSAMPVQVITRRTIELMGSRRLDEVLKEQTGIAIVNNISGGSRSVGVQLQGFGSEYVMVLIDGQPMVGRNNGNFDLSRISVSNIERIEIVKGASSCLFGSDAMGGAINIITRYGAIEPQAQLALNYGSFNMLDATLDAETPFDHQRGSAHFSANYYRTDGFNTNPYLQSGQSSPPYRNLDLQSRVRYQLHKNTYIGTNIRYGARSSDMQKNWDSDWQAKDTQDERDINFSLSLDHTFRSGIRSVSRYYLSNYNVDQYNTWKGEEGSTGLKFIQTVHRVEQQFAKNFRSGLNLTGGLGGSLEAMNDRAMGKVPTLSTMFAYLQGDKRIGEKLDLRGGLRYDRTNSYGGKVNPSFGFQYYFDEHISVKGGIGAGFKAPDYRMRYLVFYNPSANYMVIGNELLKETLGQMQEAGQISEVFHLADRLNQNLKPERSTSYNLGTQWKPTASVLIEAGLFYHYLRNQIDAVPVATGTQISQIYSYQNLPKATNKGVETSVQWQVTEDLQFQLGYQYLMAKDLSVKDSIRAGNWPYNQKIHDPKTGVSKEPTAADYWGMLNRSRHMFNARLFYQFKPLQMNASLRANYRGKYPFADYNNNGFIDRYDIFVPEHLLLHAYVEKSILRDRVSLRFNVDNILDFKHELMPGQAGRTWMFGARYRIQR